MKHYFRNRLKFKGAKAANQTWCYLHDIKTELGSTLINSDSNTLKIEMKKMASQSIRLEYYNREYTKEFLKK